jgi:hypothetical protein
LQKRARAEREAVKAVETPPDCASASSPRDDESTNCDSRAEEGGNGRAKRSTAGKIRQSRFLDDDIPEGGISASCHRAPTPAKSKGQIALRSPLQLSDGADPTDGMWVGECIGRWKGNKLYAGALIAKRQYVAVGADVLLKAEPGYDPVPCASAACARPQRAALRTNPKPRG